MKKVKLLMLSAIFVALVSGCGMKTNIQLEINSDKNVDLKMIMAFDDEMIDTMLSMNSDNGDSKTVTDSERWDYLNEGLAKDFDKGQIKKYEEGKFKGYTVSLSGGPIDEVTGKTSEKLNLASMTDGSTDAKDAKLFTKNGDNYVSNLTFDVKDNESLSSMSSYSSNMDLYEMNLVIKLPSKAVSNNADSVSKDGKTLTWDLTKGSKDINFEFNFNGASSSDNNMIYYVAGGVAIVLVIGAVVVLNNKKKVTA